MRSDQLGELAIEWLALGAELPQQNLRLVLADVDGVITRGEGHPVEIAVLQRLAARAQCDRRDVRISLRGRVYGCQSFDDVQLHGLAFTARDHPIDVGQNESEAVGGQPGAQVDPCLGHLTEKIATHTCGSGIT